MEGTQLQTFPLLVSCKRSYYVRVRLKASTQPIISLNPPRSAAPSTVILNQKWATGSDICDGQVVSHHSYVWDFDFHLFLSALGGRRIENTQGWLYTTQIHTFVIQFKLILVSLKGLGLKMILINKYNTFMFFFFTHCMHECVHQLCFLHVHV